MTLVEVIVLTNVPLEIRAFDVNGKVMASLSGVEVMTGNCGLLSDPGRGPTPAAAMRDYARKISNKKIVVNAMLDSRREFPLPSVNHPE